MKALVAAFNQEKALVGAFSVIVQPVVEKMDRFTALVLGPSNIVTLTHDSAGDGPRRDVDPLLHESSQREPETVDDAEVVGDCCARYGLFNLPFIRWKSGEKISS